MTDDELLAAGWKLRPADGFMENVGPLWSRREGAGFAFALRAGSRHANALGLIHGGLLCTLADHAMLLNAWQSAGRRPCVTVSLDARFVATALPGDLLLARGHVDDQGKALIFASGSVAAMRSGACHDVNQAAHESVIVRASAVIRVQAAPAGRA